MGRPRLHRLRSSFRSIDVRSLLRNGRIARGDEALKAPSGEVVCALIWRGCRLGGKRPYIACPRCGALRLVLFFRLAEPREPLACRECHELVYETTGMSPSDRAFARRDRIVAQLGGKGSALDLPWKPPARMSAETYFRLRQEAVEAEIEGLRSGLAALRGRRA